MNILLLLRRRVVTIVVMHVLCWKIHQAVKALSTTTSVSVVGRRTISRQQILRPSFLVGDNNVLKRRQQQQQPRIRMYGSSSKFDEDAFVSKQIKTSSNLQQQEKNEDTNDHINHQRSTFDELATYFASDEAIPNDLVPVYQHLARKIIATLLVTANEHDDDSADDKDNTNISLKILDVACGTGPFFHYLINDVDNRNNNDLQLDITGVDLSSNMVKLAKEYATKVLKESTNKHSIDVIESDILHYNPDAGSLYDAILANACFGNFYNQNDVLKHFTDLLRYDPSCHRKSHLFITHPLGIAFVNQKLHKQDTKTVPNKLPSCDKDWYKLLIDVPFQLETLCFNTEDDGGDVDDGTATSMPLYYASLERVRYKLLTKIIRLRGKVDTGYGRGGKKLGFPTANLPSKLFHKALSEIPAGVYFGWALLENNNDDDGSSGSSSSSSMRGRNVPHKAVVNVGYSPTFEGQENPEKIVEAHLILPATDGEEVGSAVLDPPDFYGETMKLQLLASLRPEIKFDSFDALISQITADKHDSGSALDRLPYSQFLRDDFLSTANKDTTTWIGQDGGNDESSWEFQDMKIAVEKL